jgi:alpha-N-arabinofuranosidase
MQEWVEYLTFAGRSPMADLRRQNGRDEPWKVRYWGVGNESWGCGGRMRPEYYADQYRRFQTYLRNFSGNRLYKIACGASGADYNWTEVLMRDAGRTMRGLSVHYYCGSGRRSRSATQFEEEDWFALLQRALRVDEIVSKHADIMDKHDPEKRIGMIFDEWGAWHRVEPGTNPRFLYQQNTLRDALVAGLTLNIFNQHCDRVKMANIAQTVNVLQAMILTQGEEMLVTPTYHVFEMYTVHHDATLLPTDLECGQYEFDSDGIPTLNASASRDAAGKIHVSLCNLDPNRPVEVACELKGAEPERASGRVLTAETMTAHNTFEKPGAIAPAPFRGFELAGGNLTATVPPKSVVVLEIE